MGVPSTRTPVRIARGTYANLTTVNALAALQEGEICFATDQDRLYVKEGSGLTSISASSTSSPTPSNISASPAFASGTGTQADPFVVTSAAVPFSGGTAESAQEITLTGTAGDFVIFTDNSVTASGDRFSGQVVGNVNSGGTFKFKLKYEDTPGTTVNNTTYNGLVQIGTAHFSFTVVQSNLTALSQSVATTIAGTGGVGNVLTCTPGTATGGTGTITYTTRWQRSFNGINGFFDIGGATGNTYTQTNSDAGYYVRAISTATDSTPAGQGGPLTLELPSGVTAQIPTGAAPVINNLVLSEDDTTGARFTSKVFSADFTMGNDGTPTSQKSIKGTVTATFENFPSTDTVSSTSNNVSYNVTGSPSWSSNSSNSNSWHVPLGVFLQDHGTTLKVAIYHTTGSSASSSVYERFVDLYTGGMTGTQNNFSWNYSGELRRSKTFHVGVDHDGRKYIHWPGATSYNYGGTYYWGDNNSPRYYARPFEFTTSNGTHFFQNDSSNIRYLYRRRASDNSHTYRQNPTGWNYIDHCIGCEYNGDLFYVWRDNSAGWTRWTTHSSTSAAWSTQGSFTSTGYDNSGNMTEPQHLFVHKNTIFMIASRKLWKYNGSSFTQLSGWSGGQSTVYGSWNDDTYLYIQYSASSSATTWWRSNNLGVTWVQDYTSSGTGAMGPASWAIVGGGGSDRLGGSRLRALGWDFYMGNYNNSWGYSFYSRQINQVVVTFASNSQLATINVGDFMRVNGVTDIKEYGLVTNVNTNNSTITLNMNTNPTAGQTMETLASIGSSSATKYLVISSTGNITGYQGSDPGFVEISPGTAIDLTFPATFPSGNAPDDEFAAGTVMQVTGKATNVSASDTFNSNQVTPT